MKLTYNHDSFAVRDKKSGTKSEDLDSNNKQLPLAHGLVHALRLIIDSNLTKKGTGSREIFMMLTNICCRAIEVSLVVVADINDDVDEQSFEQQGITATKQRWKSARSRKSGSAPINVNTGALGANATFASCKPISKEELFDRLAMQRILVSVVVNAIKFNN